MRLRKALFLIACLTILAGGGASYDAARAEDLADSLRTARESEARGDYSSAGNQYFSLLDSPFSNTPLPHGIQVALGRRAVACFTIAARRGMQNVSSDEGWAHCEALNMLEKCWRTMQRLEPNSPTWPYLMATRECSQGRYADARNHLQQSMRTTGGQSSVRQKAQALLSHINKFANIDQARMTASDRAAVQALLSGQFVTNVASSSSSSSSSGGYTPDAISDSERRARDAENAGDAGAAARFRSGGTTVEDHSRYW